VRGIYFAGNFLSQSTGVRGIGEELAERFKEREFKVFTASHYVNRLARMADLLWVAWFYRNDYQVAIVEVYSDMAFRWAEILCRFLNYLHKPFILTLHGGKLPEFAKEHHQRFSKLIRSAKFVTTPSKYLQREFMHIRDDIVYIPNGIDLDRYRHSVQNQIEPKLIWLRAIHQIYNPGLAIEVLHRISLRYPNAKLTMIGPDKNDGSLIEVKSLIQAYKLEDKVHFTGAIPKRNVGQLLSQGHIFLNTTNYESFGVSVLEAAACGLCIVTTNVGELSYLWEDGVDALLVPPNDPDAMAVAVKQILTEPGLAEGLSTNARRKAEKYDWSWIFPQWVELINSII